MGPLVPDCPGSYCTVAEQAIHFRVRTRNIVMIRLVFAATILCAAAAAIAQKVDLADWQGKRMPKMRFTTLDGKTLDADDLAGKTVLLQFMASWCVTCKKVTPNVDRLYKRFEDQGLVVVGIGGFENEEEFSALKRFVEATGLSFPVAADEQLTEALGVQSLPSLVLVGKNGFVEFVQAGWNRATERQLEAAIRASLRKPESR